MKKKLIVGIITLVAVVEYGYGVHTNSVKNGVSDWTSSASYDDGYVPQAGDVVLVPNQTSVTLLSTDTDSCQLVSSLGRVLFMGAGSGSTLTIDVAEGTVLTNNCSIKGFNGNYGRLVKTGKGELALMATDPSDYWVNQLVIETGVLRGPTAARRGVWNVSYVTVAAGAAFHLPLFDWMLPIVGGSSHYINFLGLDGAGAVWYDETKVTQMRVTRSGTFSGELHGAYMLPFIQGCVAFTGTASDFGQNMTVANNWGDLVNPVSGHGGVVSVKKIGLKGQASSVGLGNLASDSRGGGFVYIGDDDDMTDREFIGTTSNPDGPTFFDAGHHGGVTFTGLWRLNGGLTADMSGHFVVMGSNTTPCVLANDILSWTKNDHPYTIHLQKKGTGTWRLADCATRTWTGALTVDEGRIQFDSLADAGELCALGYATTLTLPYRTVYDAAQNVDWAHRLGSVDTDGQLVEGELEYLGAEAAKGVGRATVLAGAGRLDAAGTGALYLHNVSGLGTGARRLTLDGAAGTTNLLVDIVDSNACVSVVKDGAGQWTIGGELDFSGDLTVNAGTLVVRNDSARPYSWFRFNVKELHDNTQNNVVMQDLALYDAEGRRQNIGLEYAFPDPYPTNQTVQITADYWAKLPPGGVAYGVSGWYAAFNYATAPFTEGMEYDVRRLFDDISSGKQAPYSISWRRTESGGFLRPAHDNADTWHRIVMRLTNGAPAIVRYDYSRGSGTDAETRSHPVYFGLDGSVDGINWDPLHDATPADDHSGDSGSASYKWMSDGTAFASAATLRPGQGYPLARTHRTLAATPLANVGTVSVAAGATLKADGTFPALRHLRVDAAGAGTLDGFAFSNADGCSLDVAHLPDAGTALPLTITNAVDLANVSGWNLTLDGIATRRYKIGVSNSRIVVAPVGFAIIIR
jgi:autotransporter-associated beta strand protein